MAAFGADGAAGLNHFAAAGYAEGRSVTFDGLEYIASYGDLVNALGPNADAGAAHYIQAGRFEGRTTSFDGLEYIASYGDLIGAFGASADAGATPGSRSPPPPGRRRRSPPTSGRCRTTVRRSVDASSTEGAKGCFHVLDPAPVSSAEIFESSTPTRFWNSASGWSRTGDGVLEVQGRAARPPGRRSGRPVHPRPSGSSSTSASPTKKAPTPARTTRADGDQHRHHDRAPPPRRFGRRHAGLVAPTSSVQ